MNPLEQKFEDLLTRLDEVVAQLNSGRLVDFEQLNREISEACAEAQGAEPELAKAVKPIMGRMIGKLDEVALGIANYQNNLLGKDKP